MTEWKDFLGGLPEETALIISLTMALENAMKALDKDGEGLIQWQELILKQVLKTGQKYRDQYVR